jgi:mycothiol synthase
VTEYAWQSDPDPAVVRALLDAVAAVDGRPSLDPGGSLPREFRGGETLLATDGPAADGSAAVGLVHLDAEGDSQGHAVAELLVRPDARGHGLGAALATRLLDRRGLADAEPGDTLRVWAHGDRPAAARLAAAFGFRRARELRRLLLADAEAAAATEPRLPDGVRLRPFVVGADEDAVLEVNRLAFAWHPEQGAMDRADLAAAEAEPWFDPAGFLLAVDAADRLLGFHWTKVHADARDEHGHPTGPIGEVYVVGVRPDAQGGGLGRALTLAGLRYLHAERRLRRVMLYVESDNEPALAVYAKLGFTLWDADVQYAR